jgi:ABC-2 type transport system permease protein
MNRLFSWRRIGALLFKEVLQIRRDRPTLAMIMIVPMVQLFIFGAAINMNPRHLPTAVAIGDPSPMARSVVAALANSVTSRSSRRARIRAPRVRRWHRAA